MKKVKIILLTAIIVFGLCSCKSKEVNVDYWTAKSFESALNEGEDLTGKVVQFTVDELHPDSAFGYNLWAGEHLNFISAGDPKVKAGSKMTVKVVEVTEILGSWFITYEKLETEEQ